MIWIFPGYGRTGTKRVEIHVEIQDMKNFQDMEIFQDKQIILDMEVKHHTLYHTTVGNRKTFLVKNIIYTLTHFINSC